MRWKKTACMLLAAVIWVSGISASASSIKSLQNQKSQNEKELKNIQSQISGLESRKSALSSEINGLNDELTETLLNIAVLESDLADKEVQIDEAQIAYEEARETEERQYEAMKLRIQYLYEAGSESYLELFLTSDSMAELMNMVDYAGELQEYDNRLLDEYKAAKQAVIELQQRLEEEKAELLEMQEQLEEEKANLQSMIARKQTEVANFDSQLSAARAKASEYQQKIKEQNSQIKKLQEEAARAAAAAKAAAAKNAAKSSGGTSSGGTSSNGTSSNGTSSNGNSGDGAMGSSGNSGGSSSGSSGGSSSGSSGGGSSSGGGTGSSIASYGLQFVGRPYVSGGNSLTNGTDCSGFVNLVHAHFGISTPRQSGALAGGGRAVSDSDKQPGDVVCYQGHVGIYIGNNQIVHASTPSSGIKVTNMYYRSILGIRRYW
ncbi:MAG: C40 family peptidase [Lachnospiraceae bacterium]|nr:C40 family peptidase [Lachnospiraceae bacterium]